MLFRSPISTAIQKLSDDFRTGSGIQDGAILDRHLRQPITKEYDISTTNQVITLDLLNGYSQSFSAKIGRASCRERV